MENSPFLQPSFLLTVFISVITFIAWLVKLERRNAVLEKETARLETESAKNKVEYENELKELHNELKRHTDNGDIHFNLRISQQVEKTTELKFNTLDGDLRHLRQKVEQGFERVNQKLDKLTGRE